MERPLIVMPISSLLRLLPIMIRWRTILIRTILRMWLIWYWVLIQGRWWWSSRPFRSDIAGVFIWDTPKRVLSDSSAVFSGVFAWEQGALWQSLSQPYNRWLSQIAKRWVIQCGNEAIERIADIPGLEKAAHTFAALLQEGAIKQDFRRYSWEWRRPRPWSCLLIPIWLCGKLF